MNIGRIVKMAVAGAVAYLVVDYVVLNYVLAGAMASMTSIMNPAVPSMAMWMLVDVVAAILFAVVFDRVGTSFGSGWMGGAVFGGYVGVMFGVPTWIGLQLYLKDVSYSNAWLFIASTVVDYVAMGAAAGAAGGDETAKA